MAGPAPSFAHTWTRFGRKAKILNETYKFGSENATNFLDLYNTYREGDGTVSGLEGEFLSTVQLEEFRAFLAAPLTVQRLQTFLLPEIREFGRVIAATETTPYGILSRLRDYMITNSQTLNSRGMTIDTSSSGSPTGNGAIHRLTVDEDGHPLECTGAELKTFTCIRDQASGAQAHAEVFEFLGTDREKDGLQWSGSGFRRTITASHALSGGLLENPSFETGPTTNNLALTSTTQITGWTVTTAANWKTYSAAGYYYRGYPNAPSTLWGLECIASDQIAQTLRTRNPATNFMPGGVKVPHFLSVAWKRKSSATGNIVLHLGAQSLSTSIASGTNDVWNVAVLTVGTKSWHKNFNEADLDVKIVIDTLATGTIVIDDVVLDRFTNLDGTWWVVLGGDTTFLRTDTLTFTDTDGGSRGINSYWLWRAFAEGDAVSQAPLIGGWLPTNNGGAETIADPS